MKTLTNDGCSDWLKARKIAEQPYGSAQLPGCSYAQFPLPAEAQCVSADMRCIVEAIKPFSEALLHFTDWPLYKPDEMEIVAAIRAAHGERCPLIESPGHFFNLSEADLLTGLFTLAICYNWTAYLYFDHRATFLCWEGDLLDTWTFDPSQANAIRVALSGGGD